MKYLDELGFADAIRVIEKDIPAIPFQYYKNWLTPLDTGRREFVSDLETYDEKIYNRIGYIISSIWKHFNVKLNGWMFSNCNLCYYDEDEVWEYYNAVGYFDNEKMQEEISYVLYDEPFHILRIWEDNIKALRNGIHYDGSYQKSFPTRWIYEDFEEELALHCKMWKEQNPQKVLQAIDRKSSDGVTFSDND